MPEGSLGAAKRKGSPEREAGVAWMDVVQPLHHRPRLVLTSSRDDGVVSMEVDKPEPDQDRRRTPPSEVIRRRLSACDSSHRFLGRCWRRIPQNRHEHVAARLYSPLRCHRVRYHVIILSHSLRAWQVLEVALVMA